MTQVSLPQTSRAGVMQLAARSRGLRRPQVGPHLMLVFFVLTSIYPFVFALLASLKNNTQFYSNFWAPTPPFHWENYALAWKQLSQGFLNSVIVSSVSVVGVVIMASLTSWTFARYQWPGKEVLYYLILGLMMVPGFLTLVPLYWMVRDLRLTGSLAAIFLPYLAGGQVFPIFLMRTFFENLPGELFDSARVDGAGEITTFFKIGLPMCKPIVITVAIMDIMGTWNDFFWPLVAAGQNRALHTAMVRTFNLTGLMPEYGLLTAAYVIISVPMILMFIFGMRYYISGLTSGAVKI
jgi:multiple sugar transport system permease protein